MSGIRQVLSLRLVVEYLSQACTRCTALHCTAGGWLLSSVFGGFGHCGTPRKSPRLHMSYSSASPVPGELMTPPSDTYSLFVHITSPQHAQ